MAGSPPLSGRCSRTAGYLAALGFGCILVGPRMSSHCSVPPPLCMCAYCVAQGKWAIQLEKLGTRTNWPAERKKEMKKERERERNKERERERGRIPNLCSAFCLPTATNITQLRQDDTREPCAWPSSSLPLIEHTAEMPPCPWRCPPPLSLSYIPLVLSLPIESSDESIAASPLLVD